MIGAWGTNSNTGSAYVFTNTNGTWSQIQKLTASDGASGDNFGSKIAIDGDTCVIGANGTNTGTGSAYVFTNTDGIWSQTALLIAPDGASGDFFGTSVALDGDTCVIGAMGTNSETGSAYVFEYVDTPDEWIQWGPALTANGGETSGHFGFSVALDGDTCVIGANLTNTNAGSAYVFTNTGETWTQAVELTATDGADNDYFGFSVALDGNTCVIGANGTDSYTGSAYVFTNAWRNWSQVAELTATVGASGDFFGSSIALEGDTCVIGANGTNTGSVYVYRSNPAATGACCYDGLCFSITESECTAVGGSFTAEACSADTACPTACSSDSDNDGDVDIEDLMNLLATFGACP